MAFPYPLTIDTMLLWNSTYCKLYNIFIQYLGIHHKLYYTPNLCFNTFMTVFKFLHCKRGECKVQRKLIHNSMKFSHADRRVRMWRPSDVPGTNSIPSLRVRWRFGSTKTDYHVSNSALRISIWPVTGWNATPLASGRSQNVVACGLGCLFLVVDSTSVNRPPAAM